MKLQPQFPEKTPGLLLVQWGGTLLALGGVVSWSAAPDRVSSLPWYGQLLLGSFVVLVLSATSSEARLVARRRLRMGTGANVLSGATLAVGYVLAITLPLLTAWRADKVPWLSPVYATIPSLAPYAPSWVGAGISPNQTGGILASFAAFSIGFLLHCCRTDPAPSWLQRIRAAGPTALLGAIATAVVVLSWSRAALAALLVATFFALVLRDRRWLWGAIGLFAAGMAVALVRPSAFGAVGDLLLREEPLETKLLARADIWLSALQGIVDHAFTGIGLGTLNDVIPVRYPYETVGLSYTVSQAHNMLLDTALTLGLPAASGFALLSAGLLAMAAAGLEGRTRGHQGMVVGAGAAFVACLVFGLTDALSLSTPSSLLFWLWAAVVLVLKD